MTPPAVQIALADTQSTPPPFVRRAVRLALDVVGHVGLLALFGATALLGSARWFWGGELAVSFAWQLGQGALLGALYLLLIRRRKEGLVALGLALYHLGPELRLYWPRPEPPAQVDTLPHVRVASCNLLWTNEQFGGFHNWLLEHDPDVVVLLELSPSWRRRIDKTLAERYPYRFVSPDPATWTEDTWGTAILSRLPLEETRRIPLPDSPLRPPMEAVVRVGDESLLVRGAHPMRPGRDWRNERRDLVLRTLADQDWSMRSALFGDLNICSTSPVFGELTERSGLVDSRRGFGRQPSYNTKKQNGFLSVPIDHCLISDGIWVRDRYTAPLPGSDHLMIVVDLVLTPREAPSDER